MTAETLWAPVAGKYGRTRDGRKVGPMASVYASGEVWSASGHAWHKNGCWDPGRQTPLDLIAEWADVIVPASPVDLSKIRPGDEIEVRLRVDSVDDGYPTVRIGSLCRKTFDDDTSVIRHIPATRSIAVGCWVTLGEEAEYGKAFVLGVDGSDLWIRDVHGKCWTWTLKQGVELVEPA